MNKTVSKRRYRYEPLTGKEDENSWSEAVRHNVLKNYNHWDIYI
ncbi:hypothetical protein [Sneathiella sp.]